MPRLRPTVIAAAAAALAACASPQPPPREAGPYLLFFETDSAELTEEARAVARRAAADAAALNPSALVVLGFASREGDAEVNRELAQQRVETVERALVAAGVEPSLIRPLPMGEAGATRADVSERHVRILLLR